MQTVKLPNRLNRGTDAIKCECGGYCGSEDATVEEEQLVGCGRRHCCSRAFVCSICSKRYLAMLHAPEMGW